MRGRIYAINPNRGMVAIETENNGYSIFELLNDDNINVGDEVSWTQDTSLGSTILTNKTRDSRFEVYFQNHWVQKHQLRQQLLIR